MFEVLRSHQAGGSSGLQSYGEYNSWDVQASRKVTELTWSSIAAWGPEANQLQTLNSIFSYRPDTLCTIGILRWQPMAPLQAQDEVVQTHEARCG